MTKIASELRQHWLRVTFLGNATIAENQGPRGRSVQRSRNLSQALEGTKANATNVGGLGTSSWIVGRKKKMKVNGHATGCPRKINEKLVSRHMKYWLRMLRRMKNNPRTIAL